MGSDIAQIGVFNETLPLDECLERLEKYGEPRLSKNDIGWHCAIDVFVTGEGVRFEVKTGFREKTPTGAANLCYQLLIKALDKIRKGGAEAPA